MLRTAPRICAGLAMAALISGCATYRPASLPAPAPERAAAEPTVAIGSGVRVILHSGEVVVGRVTEMTTEHLVIRRPGQFGAEQSVVIPRSDVRSVELKEITSESKSIAITLVVATVAYLAMIAHGLAGLGNLN